MDFVNNTLTINHTITQTTIGGTNKVVARDKVKRQSSFRTFPLIDSVKHFLQTARFNRYGQILPHEHDYICVDQSGNLFKPESVSKGFSKLLHKHGMRPIRFHDLRHSCASILIANRVPLIEVKQWMGHCNLATTADLYAHLDFSCKEKSADLLKKL